jgi:hypothetical protein
MVTHNRAFIIFIKFLNKVLCVITHTDLPEYPHSLIHFLNTFALYSAYLCFAFYLSTIHLLNNK